MKFQMLRAMIRECDHVYVSNGRYTVHVTKAAANKMIRGKQGQTREQGITADITHGGNLTINLLCE